MAPRLFKYTHTHTQEIITHAETDTDTDLDPNIDTGTETVSETRKDKSILTRKQSVCAQAHTPVSTMKVCVHLHARANT